MEDITLAQEEPDDDALGDVISEGDVKLIDKVVNGQIEGATVTLERCVVAGTVVGKKIVNARNSILSIGAFCDGTVDLTHVDTPTVLGAVRVTAKHVKTKNVTGRTCILTKCEVSELIRSNHYLHMVDCPSIHDAVCTGNARVERCKHVNTLSLDGTAFVDTSDIEVLIAGLNVALDKSSITQKFTMAGMELRATESKIQHLHFLTPQLDPEQVMAKGFAAGSTFGVQVPPLYCRQNMIAVSQRNRRSVLNFSTGTMRSSSGIAKTQVAHLINSTVHTASRSSQPVALRLYDGSTVEVAGNCTVVNE